MWWWIQKYSQVLEQVVQGSGAVTIPGSIYEMCNCGTKGHGIVIGSVGKADGWTWWSRGSFPTCVIPWFWEIANFQVSVLPWAEKHTKYGISNKLTLKILVQISDLVRNSSNLVPDSGQLTVLQEQSRKPERLHPCYLHLKITKQNS